MFYLFNFFRFIRAFFSLTGQYTQNNGLFQEYPACQQSLHLWSVVADAAGDDDDGAAAVVAAADGEVVVGGAAAVGDVVY